MLQVQILLACSALPETIFVMYAQANSPPLAQTIGSQVKWVNRLAIINEKILLQILSEYCLCMCKSGII